jgi:hypothetical protein
VRAPRGDRKCSSAASAVSYTGAVVNANFSSQRFIRA